MKDTKDQNDNMFIKRMKKEHWENTYFKITHCEIKVFSQRTTNDALTVTIPKCDIKLVSVAILTSQNVGINLT